MGCHGSQLAARVKPLAVTSLQAFLLLMPLRYPLQPPLPLHHQHPCCCFRRLGSSLPCLVAATSLRDVATASTQPGPSIPSCHQLHQPCCCPSHPLEGRGRRHSSTATTCCLSITSIPPASNPSVPTPATLPSHHQPSCCCCCSRRLGSSLSLLPRHCHQPSCLLRAVNSCCSTRPGSCIPSPVPAVSPPRPPASLLLPLYTSFIAPAVTPATNLPAAAASSSYSDVGEGRGVLNHLLSLRYKHPYAHLFRGGHLPFFVHVFLVL